MGLTTEDIAKEKIRELEEQSQELSKLKSRKNVKKEKKEQSHSDLWENIKQCNIYVTGLNKSETKSWVRKNIFENSVDYFSPNLMKNTNLQI